MIVFIVSLISTLALAAETAPTAFPIFLKQGFSSVLEFEDTPTKIVIGDSQNFQVEKIGKSLVLRTMAPDGLSNMFVYFQSEEPRLFVLNASYDADPTLYKKFERPPKAEVKKSSATVPAKYATGIKVVRREFDSKRDYLVVGLQISAGPQEVLSPDWNQIRLTHNQWKISPTKLWSERKEIQRDSRISVRLVFAKPGVPKSFDATSVTVPLKGKSEPLRVSLKGGR